MEGDPRGAPFAFGGKAHESTQNTHSKRIQRPQAASLRNAKKLRLHMRPDASRLSLSRHKSRPRQYQKPRGKSPRHRAKKCGFTQPCVAGFHPPAWPQIPPFARDGFAQFHHPQEPHNEDRLRAFAAGCQSVRSDRITPPAGSFPAGATRTSGAANHFSCAAARRQKREPKPEKVCFKNILYQKSAHLWQIYTSGVILTA